MIVSVQNIDNSLIITQTSLCKSFGKQGLFE